MLSILFGIPHNFHYAGYLVLRGKRGLRNPEDGLRLVGGGGQHTARLCPGPHAAPGPPTIDLSDIGMSWAV